MAHVGQKRPSSHDSEGGSDSGRAGKDEAGIASPSKRPAIGSSSFSFRPSPLQSATKGFSLRQSSLKPSPISAVATTNVLIPNHSAELVTEQSSGGVEKGGFLKLNQENLKLVGVSTFSVMGAEGKPVMTTGGSSTAASVSHSRSPFTQSESGGGFKSVADSPKENYFATAGQTKTPSTPSDNGVTPDNQRSEEGTSPTTTSIFLEGSKASPLLDNDVDDGEQGVFGAGSSRQPSLPEVHSFTGEESEKNIVLIAAKLYVFEGDTRTWKDRGRGEIRLNDSAKDEGVFQSRLVMRASGTYRVLLNTHLWSQMSCERVNQKSIRVTAQQLTSTEDIGVYLITGATKDIQTLFTAIDRRIQALKRNVPSNSTQSITDTPDPLKTAAILPDEEEDKDECLSRQSSPDSSPEAVRVRRVERPPPVISVSNADSDQRSQSSGQSSDKGGSVSPVPSNQDKTTPTTS